MDNSHLSNEGGGVMGAIVKFGEMADQIIPAMVAADRERMPVLNHEARPAIGKTLRLGLWMRDSGVCWICGHTADRPVADHVRPRSMWPADLVKYADRSDNLRLACWDCNADKSNYLYPGGDMPLGITAWCLRCAEFDRDDDPVRCFCMRCGMGGLVKGATAYLSAEESCDIHPGRPKRGCDRCAEQGVA